MPMSSLFHHHVQRLFVPCRKQTQCGRATGSRFALTSSTLTGPHVYIDSTRHCRMDRCHLFCKYSVVGMHNTVLKQRLIIMALRQTHLGNAPCRTDARPPRTSSLQPNPDWDFTLCPSLWASPGRWIRNFEKPRLLANPIGLHWVSTGSTSSTATTWVPEGLTD